MLEIPSMKGYLKSKNIQKKPDIFRTPKMFASFGNVYKTDSLETLKSTQQTFSNYCNYKVAPVWQL